MTQVWKDRIHTYLGQVNASTDLGQIGQNVRRPAGCNPNSQLLRLLRSDNRFCLFAANNGFTLYVGLSPQWIPEGGVYIGNHRPGTIPFLTDLFAGHLETLGEEILVTCEQDNTFAELFREWLAQTGLRGSYNGVKSELKTRGILVIHKQRMILGPSNRPGRIQQRLRSINPLVLEENLDGVLVDQFNFQETDDGDLLVLNNGQSHSVEGFIECKNDSGIIFTNLRPYHTHLKFRFYRVIRTTQQRIVKLRFPAGGIPLACGERLEIIVKFFAQTDNAHVNTKLKFWFTMNNDDNVYLIGRSVSIRVGDSAIHKLLKPTEPYKRRRQVHDTRLLVKEVDGERPVGSDDSNVAFRSPGHHRVPSEWIETCRLGLASDKLAVERQALGTENFKDLFHKLLWTEELQMDVDIKGYSRDNMTMTAERSFLRMTVAGLSEKRPSILKGDSVIVHRPTNQTEGSITKYRGYVHQVQRDEVLLKFHKGFHASYINDELVTVEFTYSRMPLRLCHQGVDNLTNALLEYILPSAEAFTDLPVVQIDPVDIHPVDRSLNEQQMLAVRNIVQRTNPVCPYIIFGPPGTGKTSTLVEAILQVGKKRPDEKILICAPSNTAADLLLRRLAKSLPKSELFRFNSYQRERSTVDEVVLAYSQYDSSTNCFKFPVLEAFMKYKYVVCTCSMAGKLTNYGIPRGYFASVFVDEAGHGWEPEIIAAFSSLLNREEKDSSGQLILAGDPKQLGPIVRSDAVDDEHGGLSISLLDRLIQSHPAYLYSLEEHPDTAGYNPRVLSMLLKCYRCHEDILRLPNEMFYKSALIPAADALTTHNMATWSGLPKPGFPLIFHGIEGLHQREANSPSWFNVPEIQQVFHYVKDLVDNERIPPSEIAVIAPYHKQVTKIASLLKAPAYGERYKEIAVGTCEKMQGQERRVIIISTVRSSDDFLDDDRRFNLGFVSSPKRFNVAVTRAKALLIVVGNPHVLVRDPSWGALLRYCHQRGGYRGCHLPDEMRDGDNAIPTEEQASSDDEDDEDDEDDDDDLLQQGMEQMNLRAETGAIDEDWEHL